MSRKLDAAIAEALGEKVIWIKILDGYKVLDAKCNKTQAIMTVVPVVEMENGATQYTNYSGNGIYVETNLVPKYSTDGEAMLELDREMRERGWRLEVRRWSDSHNWVEANYYHEDCLKNYKQAQSEPLARALAAYRALTGKEWEGEG